MLISSKLYRKTEVGRASYRKISAANKKKRRRAAGRYKSVKHFVDLKGRQQWGIKPCHYCGLDNNSVAGVGLDRLDNTIGYMLDNVVSCCTECNRARSDKFTPDEMLIIGTAIRQVNLARLSPYKVT